MLRSRVQFLWVMWRERFNSVSHVEKKGSILWVIFFVFEKNCESRSKRVQLFDKFSKKVNSFKKFNSSSHIEKVLLNKCSILRVIFWWGFNSFSHLEKKVQFCESCSKKKKVQFFESCFFEKTKRLNSLSHNFCSKKSIILRVVLKIGSILWVSRFQKRVQFFESYQKKSSIFESYPKKKELNSLSYCK